MLEVKVEAVGHRFGGLVVLDGIELVARAGEVLAVVGPSGCGKSTLLGIMGGLIRPAEGRVTVAGEVAADCLNAMTPVFQDFSLLPWRDVAGNVALPLEGQMGRAEMRARVAEVLDLVGMAEFAGAWPRELSGGMKQRVGIARALAVRPGCLLMDEPLSALDAQTRALMLEEFAGLIERAGTTTVYVTHNLSEAVRLGHQVAVLSRRPGRVRAVIEIERAIGGRREGDADLVAAERELWGMIRDDAAVAARERVGG